MKTSYLITFWVLACAISCLIWLPLWWPSAQLPLLPYHHAWGALGPLCAAIIMTRAEWGRRGLRIFLHKVFRWKLSPLWYLSHLPRFTTNQLYYELEI